MDFSDAGNAQGSGGKQRKVHTVIAPDLPDHTDSMEWDGAIDEPPNEEHENYEEPEHYEEHLAKIMNTMQEGDPHLQQELFKIIQEGDSQVQQLSDLAAIETRPAKDPQKLAGLAREIAAIPEADTTPHRSKRTAASADQASAERAEKLKAARNLDFPCSDGNKTTPKPSSWIAAKLQTKKIPHKKTTEGYK
jgi:hypothetical protein